VPSVTKVPRLDIRLPGWLEKRVAMLSPLLRPCATRSWNNRRGCWPSWNTHNRGVVEGSE